MDLEVDGRHALLFDDDSMAAFVNSASALVEWNSLSIDRYDVRHLLSAPPPPRNRRRQHRSSSPNPDHSLESELDQVRYLDLPSPYDEQDLENEAERDNAGCYHAVAFSYGGPSETSGQKNTDTESGFQTPFSVPEHLLPNLPPTEKVHQIIARTAMFVRKHGGQSEIVLRVKQGDNPTFGFLMPDHNLHPYFRFLVDHQELLKSGINGKAIEEENKSDISFDQMSDAGGALSLLGSVYGSGEDEEGATEDAVAVTKNDLEEAVNADNNLAVSHGSEQNNSSLSATSKDETISKPPFHSSKERSHVIKRNSSISTVKARTTAGVKKDGDLLGAVSSALDKLQPSVSPSLSMTETYILEPPSDLKRVVDKIVEFILRNGKEFESVLVQQDNKHGRFPFLLSTNQYHPYYLKALQKAQESKLAGKSLISEKHDLGHRLDKKTVPKESDTLSLASDIPYESDRKEKFKMVIGKSKKDGQDPPSKATQPHVGVSVDAAAAAAILQAATKGIKNSNLEILSKTINGLGQGPSSEGSFRPPSYDQKPNQKAMPGVSVPVAKAIAKTAAVAAASEVDSSEAGLTREQRLKVERLKRAKMFAAVIKSGVAPLKSESSCGLSVEPSESGFSGSDSQVVPLAGRERENSLGLLDVDAFDKIEKSGKKGSTDERNERRSKRSYRSRSKMSEEEEEELNEDTECKHSRKKRRSHRPARHSRDRHKHRKRHSSSQERESQHQHKNSGTSDDEPQHKQDSSSSDEYRRPRHRRRHGSSLDDERHSRCSYRHDSSPDEYGHSRHRCKHNSCSDDEYAYSRHSHRHDSDEDDEHRHKHSSSYGDEHRYRAKSVKHREISRSERESDLEEGEILTKSDQSKVSEGGDGASREASVDLSKSYQEVRPTSQQSETAEISNDLRAKIRAMLLATL